MKSYNDLQKKNLKNVNAKKNYLTGSGLLMCLFGIIMLVVIINGPLANSNEFEQPYHKIVVETGDTLWELAQKFVTPEEDIRDLIHQIRKINNLDSAEIHPGQIILIPAS